MKSRAQLGLDGSHALERRLRQLVEAEWLRVRTRPGEREQRLAVALGVLDAQPLLRRTVLLVEPQLADRVEQVGDDADDARGVEHVHASAGCRRGRS